MAVHFTSPDGRGGIASAPRPSRHHFIDLLLSCGRIRVPHRKRRIVGGSGVLRCAQRAPGFLHDESGFWMQQNQIMDRRVAALARSPEVLATLDEWQTWLAVRGLRVRARDTYLREVVAFAGWLGGESTLADVTPDALGRYQRDARHLAAATIRKKLSAIRSWCRWCVRVQLRPDDPTADLDWPKRRKRVPRALKSDELAALESILARDPDGLNAKARRLWWRNRRIVLLLLYTGMRRAEVAALCWADLDLAAGTALIAEDSAKGGHERMVPLHRRVITEFQRTPLHDRRGAVAGHPDGRCLSHTSIGRVFERWLADQGLRISAHRLRHTCATELLRSGASLRDVQLTLGHADIRTTEGYLDVLTDQQRVAMARLPDVFI